MACYYVLGLKLFLIGLSLKEGGRGRYERPFTDQAYRGIRECATLANRIILTQGKRHFQGPILRGGQLSVQVLDLPEDEGAD